MDDIIIMDEDDINLILGKGSITATTEIKLKDVMIVLVNDKIEND